MGPQTEVKRFDSSSYNRSLIYAFRSKSRDIRDKLSSLGCACERLNERIRKGESVDAIITVDGYRIGHYDLYNNYCGIEELIMTLNGRLIE